jgi:hypothetical protein
MCYIMRNPSPHVCLYHLSASLRGYIPSTPSRSVVVAVLTAFHCCCVPGDGGKDLEHERGGGLGHGEGKRRAGC